MKQILREWYGCPYCTSPNYSCQRQVEDEAIYTWFVCLSCRRGFERTLLYWVESEAS